MLFFILLCCLLNFVMRRKWMGRCERCLQLIWDVQAIVELTKPFKSAANKSELVSRRMTSIYVLLNLLQCDTGMESMLQSLINIDRAERAKTLPTQMKNCARRAIICRLSSLRHKNSTKTTLHGKKGFSIFFTENFLSKSLKKLIPQQKGLCERPQLSVFRGKSY